jgi:segregation and condensation protein B
MNTAQAKIVIEAALLASPTPLALTELRRLFDEQVGADTIRALLDELRVDWQSRGVRLVALAGGWRFQTAPEVAEHLARLHPEKPPRYSRAVMETLAIIAYRQPVTRGDIEEIRGVTVSTQVVKTLEERGWVESIGHKDTVGRPELLATTRQFLDDLGLRSLDELPPLVDVGAEAALAAVEQRVIEFQADGVPPDAVETPTAAEGAQEPQHDAPDVPPDVVDQSRPVEQPLDDDEPLHDDQPVDIDQSHNDENDENQGSPR